MKKIIIQLFIFLGLAFLVAIVTIVGSNKWVSEKANFKIETNPQSIVIGHSHVCYAFNDSLIDDFKNMAATGESSFYTYQKAKRLILHNKGIKNIFVVFTNSQITKVANDAIWSDMYLADRYPKYAPFMSTDDLSLVAFNNPKGFLSIQNESVKRNFKFIRKGDDDYIKNNDIGGFVYLIKDSLRFGKRSPLAKERNTTYSTITTSYVQKIIALCKSNNINVYLIRTPLNIEYNGLYNEDKFQEIVRTTFAGQDFLDFKNFPCKEHEFGDQEHLNYKGAQRFSIFFNSLLKNGFLDSLDKQKVIEDEIKREMSISQINQ